jgi:hypothetical protein
MKFWSINSTGILYLAYICMRFLLLNSMGVHTYIQAGMHRYICICMPPIQTNLNIHTYVYTQESEPKSSGNACIPFLLLLGPLSNKVLLVFKYDVKKPEALGWDWGRVSLHKDQSDDMNKCESKSVMRRKRGLSLSHPDFYIGNRIIKSGKRVLSRIWISF